MRERDVERRLEEGVHKLGGRTYKWVSPGNAGVPDRIVFLPDGRVIFAELKTDTGELSARQKLQILRLKKLGNDVRVLKGKDDVNAFLKEVMIDGIRTAQLSKTSDKQSNKR